MDQHEWLAGQFEANRKRLRAVAYRMLGSLSEADDAVQEAWLRLSGADAGEIENLGGWLTTVVARVCLNQLRSRAARREESLDVHVPDPIVSHPDRMDPEQEVLLADSVGLALLIVLETLDPAERLAFVLHDMFDLPFSEIAPLVGRSPAAARQLASRARRRIRAGSKTPEADPRRQRAALDAFLAAARTGDIQALLEVLDPDVVLRADRGAAARGESRIVRGARTVARGAAAFAQAFMKVVGSVRPALVNGAAGIVAFDIHGRVFSVVGVTVSEGKIVEIDVLSDPARLSRLDLTALELPGHMD